MQVIATAGHVDHGKSTLIRALTGIEPDRWEEEKRRGLTIDLGFAWCELPSGRGVSFVDVPGHERFLGNMLAGIGPAPIVCFVVAADGGWQAQSDDHRDAVAALGIDQGLVVITRTDLAPDRIEPVTAQVRRELADTGLAQAPIVPVSAVTGQGMDDLRRVLDELVQAARPADPHARVRLWIDRAFTISGAGTVVTGTLAAGTLQVGDSMQLVGADGTREATVRGLQSRGGAAEQIQPISRSAVNLRGIDAHAISRGDALLTPDAWDLVTVLDVRQATGTPLGDAPSELVVHVGTAAVTAHVRPFGASHARLTLARPLPLALGDRLILRGSGEHAVRAGVRVIDVDPPELTRRGDGTRREEQLAAMPDEGDLRTEVIRRRAVREAELIRHGLEISTPLPDGVRRSGDWLVGSDAVREWADQLWALVRTQQQRDPLAAGVAAPEAVRALSLPEEELLGEVCATAGLRRQDGRVQDPDAEHGLGAAESSVSCLEQRLRAAPFAAPEADDLTALRLGPRELAAAHRQGRLLRLDDGVVLLPTAPALAMRELAALAQPFTLSQARQALGTTRRVAIPLLEHLDGRGWTRRVDGTRREVVR